MRGSQHRRETHVRQQSVKSIPHQRVSPHPSESNRQSLPSSRRRPTPPAPRVVYLSVGLSVEDSTSLADSARSLHSSWFAAITLSRRSGTDHPAAGESAFHGSTTPATSGRQLSGGAAAALRAPAPTPAPDGAGDQRVGGSLRHGAAFVETVGKDSWLRARLSMPVWPFSDDCYGGGEAPTEDGGGYWGVDARTNAGAMGYSLWRIPAAESAWQGED